MLKHITTTLALLAASAAMAAADVNKATPADLDGIKGIGPALSKRIVEERQKAPFKNWGDLIERVRGFGASNATRYSAAGLTVNGEAYKAVAAAPAAAARKGPAPAAMPVKAAEPARK